MVENCCDLVGRVVVGGVLNEGEARVQVRAVPPSSALAV